MAERTRWPELLAWLRGRRPELVECFVGATHEEITALFGHSPAPVPKAVLDLYASLGRDCSGFFPLSRLFDLALAEQLEDMEESLVEGRFLRIALALDHTGIGELDLYVDLPSSDGYDAAIMQVGEPWDRRLPHAHCHTVMSKVIQRAFKMVELEPRAEVGRVSQSMPREQLPQYIDAFARFAARAGLNEELRSRDDLRCGLLGGAALMFDGVGPTVPLGTNSKTGELPSYITASIWIGCDGVATFARISEQVRDHMPPLPFTHRYERAED